MSDTDSIIADPSLEVPPPAEAGRITAVSLKLPPYWPSDPQIWFAQIEAQFNTRNITSERTRFDYVISSLAPEVAHEVRDLLLKPPTATQYTTLKAALIQRTTLSEQHRLQQLFSTEEFGDRKPTQLLQRIQQLLGDKVTDSSFLRELFLQRLPSHVRMVLASSDSPDLDKLAQLADKIVEVAAPQINSTTTTSSSSEIQRLRSEILELKKFIQSINKAPKRILLIKSYTSFQPTPHLQPRTIHLTSVGTIADSEMMPANAKAPVPSPRKTVTPVNSGRPVPLALAFSIS